VTAGEQEVRKRQELSNITANGPSEPAPERRQMVQARSSKVGRNDPCPCGSGKKYKKCCGQ